MSCFSLFISSTFQNQQCIHSFISFNKLKKVDHSPSSSFNCFSKAGWTPSTGTVKDFVTKRAIYTLCYYFSELHDEFSRTWLLEFENFGNRGELRDGSYAYLLRLFKSPMHIFEISSGPDPRYHSYSRKFEIEISPSSIAIRLMRVREQVAAECASDLALVSAENLEINRQQMELSLNVGADLEPLRSLIFENDPFTSDSTPLRTETYRRLQALLTEAAVCEYLAELRETSYHDYLWLMEYRDAAKLFGKYRKHQEKFSSGYPYLWSGEYNKQGFLFNMLRLAPIQRTHPVKWIYPNQIAHRLMELRLEVGERWIQELQSIPSDHQKLIYSHLESSIPSSTSEEDE
ncbi:hypothetical protein Gasu2_25870 [Galdieria sulphuraria]|uniref:Uncharacterized protein n=1 Tax=Galdieria sulphuraria TaxID=130081 RepID=M2XZ24_GALSU|nr:uncharacterized protein Gasu_36270 [Galdieria sulphuraria]EME28888.1 hypothetical protein Gasu_36270 [Galdieria sulphuraria]GJD08277.1 hypothetical protein Gasu2_25870 [Galdieria sulphuraria]|eukprot:XP_005705408.1 hypothetical protein Gasu_36270 [Galdieria sulphuraria]